MAAVCTLYPESIGPLIRSDPKLTAEVKFYDALRAQMPSGWLVFYDIAWLGRTRPSSGPRDGQIDFIVAHPEHGILLIEVKGGRIRYDGPSRQWISRDRHGTDHDIDPFRQAVEGKYALLNKLLEVPSLKNLWIELAHAVAFTDTARPDYAVAPDAPPEIVIGCQDLTRLHQRVLEILVYSRQSSRGEFYKGSLIVGELTRLVGRGVELPNPLGVHIQEEYREILSLTEAQIRTLSLLQRVRRAALGGCAGCGKTFLALAKAKGLANQGFRTLLTCYTRPLSSFLRSVTAGTPNLDVYSLHTLARYLLPSLPAVDSAEEADRLYPTRLFDEMQARGQRPYDAVIVDEGQDISCDWWLALESCLSEGKQSVFYVFHDTHQTLFRSAGSLPTDLVEIPLEENVRNTRLICREVSRHYLGEVSIQPRGPAGRKVLYHAYRGLDDLASLLGRTIHHLLTTEALANSDMVVLTTRASVADSSLFTLQLPHGIRLAAEEPRGPGRAVFCCSISEFKGLERKVALVAEVDEFLPADPKVRDALLYVGFSRPRHHLVVFHTAAAECYLGIARSRLLLEARS